MTETALELKYKSAEESNFSIFFCKRKAIIPCFAGLCRRPVQWLMDLEKGISRYICQAGHDNAEIQDEFRAEFNNVIIKLTSQALEYYTLQNPSKKYYIKKQQSQKLQEKAEHSEKQKLLDAECKIDNMQKERGLGGHLIDWLVQSKFKVQIAGLFTF